VRLQTIRFLRGTDIQTLAQFRAATYGMIPCTVTCLLIALQTRVTLMNMPMCAPALLDAGGAGVRRDSGSARHRDKRNALQYFSQKTI
jgi:hypothetical protein